MNETSPLTDGSPGVASSMHTTREIATPSEPHVSPPASDRKDPEGEGILRPGSNLKGYRLVARLASGTTTEVWLAMLTGAQGFEKGVALKAMLSDPTRRPALVDLLTHEAAIGGRLYHPNIVQMLDFTQDAGRFFISMEYVDGLTLRQVERRLAGSNRRFPLPLLVHVVSQICRGLHYAHELQDGHGAVGFVHRNVTPENVLLSRSGAVKLIDFGASQVRSSPGPPGPGGIELPYAGPERVKNLPEDRRGDLYSLGVIMYELLCGRRPFTGEERELRSRIVEGRPLPPRELVGDMPEPIVRVIQKAMAVVPDNRPASAGQLAADLGAAYEIHLLGLQGLERDQFDLRSIFNQIFRDVPGSPGEIARVGYPLRGSSPVPARMRTPVPIPISRDRSVHSTAIDVTLTGDDDDDDDEDDVTEPCVMKLDETLSASVPAAASLAPVPAPLPPTPPLSLPSLSWLFERRDEARTTGEIFQQREELEAAPRGSIFDQTVRIHGDTTTAPSEAAGVANRPGAPLATAERSAPDIFARRRVGESPAPGRSGSPPFEERRALPDPEAVRFFDQGLAFLADKQYQLALDAWERALELDPNNRMYQTNLKRLRARL
jgi:serine/threonine protein kinase